SHGAPPEASVPTATTAGIASSTPKPRVCSRLLIQPPEFSTTLATTGDASTGTLARAVGRANPIAIPATVRLRSVFMSESGNPIAAGTPSHVNTTANPISVAPMNSTIVSGRVRTSITRADDTETARPIDRVAQ